jgi:hypothetical protein
MIAATAADDFGVVGVQFLVDGLTLDAEDMSAPYEMAWATLTVANGDHTVTAVARDAAGHTTTAASVLVTVANDITAPTITLTGPTGTVTGTVMIAATATDDFGVVGVQFLVDGLTLAAEDTSAPYEMAWATLTVANGDHTVTAVARDAAGHTTTAISSVSVANDVSAP